MISCRNTPAVARPFCVRCNTFTKFRDLLPRPMRSTRWLATGHYARIGRRNGQAVMVRGLDAAKDQSYFLWGIDRPVLDRLVLPSAQTKAETREIARRFGLRTAEKIESQDICFVPDGDHVRVIAEHLGEDAPALQPGPLQLASGEVIGEHQGSRGSPWGSARVCPADSRSRCSSWRSYRSSAPW